MAHKTLTISEEAYKELVKLKNEKESFTDVIIKLTKKKNLLEYVKTMPKNENLAKSIEKVFEERKRIKPRDVDL